jgi:hypothetical protein
MNPDYHELRKKMNRFNEWEKIYFRSVGPEKKLEHFRLLYETKQFMGAKVAAAHEEHLESLIDIQARLKKVIRLKEI